MTREVTDEYCVKQSKDGLGSRQIGRFLGGLGVFRGRPFCQRQVKRMRGEV
jgi:hypothetical protein